MNYNTDFFSTLSNNNNKNFNKSDNQNFNNGWNK